jgi:lipoprotein-anchoring transpeptidase ErfK/SrfK
MDHKGRVVPNGDGPTWGCVATAPEDAARIYAFVEIGTRVEVHW